MTAISLTLCLALATQRPTPGPATATKAAAVSERARAEREATIAKRKAAQQQKDPALGPGAAPTAKAAIPSERARAEREATIAKRRAARALRRADAAKKEADLRDYERKMAPIVANQQIEMARIRAQQQQNEMTQQALMNLQAIEAARLANERYAMQLRYWESQQPIRVIIDPRQP
jgi:hypothetical protein